MNKSSIMSQQVVIAGGSGMVGKRLSDMLTEAGYNVYILTRQHDLSKSSDRYLHWNIHDQLLDDKALEADHLINLCGAGIADQRWSDDRKKILIDSRVQPTNFLIDQFKQANRTVKTYLSASAVGYYGNRSNTLCTEEIPPQRGSFLSHVCQLWEATAHSATSIADSVSILRIGVVLSKSGGALDKITKSIPYGIASYLGDGKQYMSWIHLDDLCRMFLHCIQESGDHQVYNAVAPHPATNKELTQAAKEIINPRALLLPAPAFAIKIMLGEMSAVVLDSTRVSSERIENSGFTYHYPRLREALEHIYTV